MDELIENTQATQIIEPQEGLDEEEQPSINIQNTLVVDQQELPRNDEEKSNLDKEGLSEDLKSPQGEEQPNEEVNNPDDGNDEIQEPEIQEEIEVSQKDASEKPQSEGEPLSPPPEEERQPPPVKRNIRKLLDSSKKVDEKLEDFSSLLDSDQKYERKMSFRPFKAEPKQEQKQETKIENIIIKQQQQQNVKEEVKSQSTEKKKTTDSIIPEVEEAEPAVEQEDSANEEKQKKVIEELGEAEADQGQDEDTQKLRKELGAIFSSNNGKKNDEIVDEVIQEMEVTRKDKNIIIDEELECVRGKPVSPSKDPDYFHLGQFVMENSPERIERVKRIANNHRLIIQKIVLENFKSYYGKKEVGPFHKSFTSVVGPNGSGKSNLLESLLFVFGKRARWMRSNNLTDLIHKSRLHQDCSKASVMVTFCEIIDEDHPENYQVVQDSEFSIKRTIYKDGKTKYEIDNQTATQKEVVTLLRQQGIDLDHNRFLILQGEVEQISLMKPKTCDPSNPGLLEYLEDIIGSINYKYELDSLSMTLDKQLDNKKEIIERLKISEIELQQLHEGKNIAIDYIKKEKQAFQLLNIQYQIEKYDAKNNQAKLEKGLIELDRDMKQKEFAYRDLVNKNESFIKEFNQIKLKIEDNQKTKLDCQKKYEELNIKDAKVTNDLRHQNQKSNELKKQLKEMDQMYQKIIEEAAQTENQIPKKQKELEKLKKQETLERRKLDDMIQKVSQSTTELMEGKEKIEAESVPFKVRYQSVKNTIDELENENQLLLAKQLIYKQEAEDIQKRIKEEQTQLKQKKVYYGQMHGVNTNVEKLIQQESSLLQILKDEEEAALNKLYEAASIIEEKRQLYIETNKQSRIVTELLKAKKDPKEQLQGIIGRLGSLGMIDDSFDIAITTACPQLNFIIVKKYEDAQKAVEFLRKKKLGCATFIALDKIQWIKQAMEAPFQAPNKSQRLFDLVKADHDEYKIAFYFALKNTLVCRDIDTATKIAYGERRYRVVTTAGELIESSGAMSGGGKPKKGGMGSKLKENVTEDQIKELIKKKAEASEKVEQKKKDIKICEDKLAEYRADQKEAQKEYMKIKMDIDFREQQLEELTTKLTEIEENLEGNEGENKKRSEITANIIKKQHEAKELEDQIFQFKKKMDTIQKEIYEIGGEKMRTQKDMVYSLDIKKDELEKEIGLMEAQTQSTIKSLNRNKKEQLQTKQKLEAVQKKIEELEEDQNNLEQDGMDILSTMKSCEQNKEEYEKQYYELEQRNEETAKTVQDLKTDLDNMGLEKDEKSKQLKKTKEVFAKSTKRIKDNRDRYTKVISNYNFLNDLQEIENLDISGLEDPDPTSRMIRLMAQRLTERVNKDKKQQKNEPGTSARQLRSQANNNSHKKNKSQVDADIWFRIDPSQEISDAYLDKLRHAVKQIHEQYRKTVDKMKHIHPNVNNILEFKEKYEEHKGKIKELNDIKQTIENLKQQEEELKRLRFSEFMKGFNVISSKLKETYQTLTSGGDAELELLDSLDPFSEGIVFSVRPPKKSWKQMLKLSGGEKTLSSLALIFALHYYKSTPLYFMDEIDAALDYKNVAIVANFIKEKTKNAQFIIISLRNNTFELADQLVGIYKTDDISKIMSINPNMIEDDLVEQAADG